MTDLETRLHELGDALDLGESDAVVAGLLERLDDAREPSGATGRRSMASVWLRVAAVALVIVAGTLAIPTSRDAIADWFGLDGVDIDQEPDLSVPPDAVPDDASVVGSGSMIVVDGLEIVIGEIDVGGDFDGEPFLTKTIGPDSGIERVEVNGNPGLWIDGDPHVVTYVDGDGDDVTERFAGNTLLWHDDGVIHRVEGFPTRTAALAFATTHP